VVVALSQRHDPLSARTLRLAARLDGDSQVRETARMALGGYPLTDFTQGSNAFWLSIVLSSRPRVDGPTARAALLLTASGLALPLLPDPDGLVTACGLPEGPIRLRIAGSARRGQEHKLAEAGAADRARGALMGHVRHAAGVGSGQRPARPLPPGHVLAWALPAGLRSGPT
jgi:hypothetical protein